MAGKKKNNNSKKEDNKKEQREENKKNISTDLGSEDLEESKNFKAEEELENSIENQEIFDFSRFSTAQPRFEPASPSLETQIQQTPIIETSLNSGTETGTPIVYNAPYYTNEKKYEDYEKVFTGTGAVAGMQKPSFAPLRTAFDDSPLVRREQLSAWNQDTRLEHWDNPNKKYETSLEGSPPKKRRML